MNVLAPKTVHDILDNMPPPDNELTYFTVFADASHKANVSSVCEIFLCLVSCSPRFEHYDKSANWWAVWKSTIVDIGSITACTAANANASFGQHPSVYQLLRSANNKAKNPAHISSLHMQACLSLAVCGHFSKNLQLLLRNLLPKARNCLHNFFSLFVDFSDVKFCIYFRSLGETWRLLRTKSRLEQLRHISVFPTMLGVFWATKRK